MANIQNLWAKILGAVLVIVGLLGFVNNPIVGIFSVNALHNVVHLVTGALGLYFGFASSAMNARRFNQVFGIVYLLVAVLGFVAGGFTGTLLNTNMADHVLHVLIGLVTAGIGFFAKSD